MWVFFFFLNLFSNGRKETKRHLIVVREIVPPKSYSFGSDIVVCTGS